MGLQSLLPLALVVGGSASVLPRIPSNKNGFLSFPIVHERRHEPVLFRRDDEVTLYNHTTIAYMIDINIGTPPQKVRVQLDTGSDELWVDPDCSAVSNPKSAEWCASVGVYDPSQSSTFVDQEVTKQLAYGIGTAEIEYVSDNIALPGTDNQVLQNVIFGVALQSKDAAVPIMGVGFGNGVNLDYNNIIDELVAQGLTASRAFSVALGPSTQDDGGVIVFGGVDTKKYAGRLHAFTNLPPQGDEVTWRYWVQLDSIGLTKGGSSSSKYTGSSTPVVLDSGSTYCYLPIAVLQKMADDLGGSMDSDGNVQVPCSLMSQSGTVDFTFGDLTIHVPYSEFLRQLDANTCIIGAQPADETPLLGDTFLRSAYVVFDQSNTQIFMAPYTNCGSNEQSLPATPGAAANITGQCTSDASESPAASVWMALA